MTGATAIVAALVVAALVVAGTAVVAVWVVVVRVRGLHATIPAAPPSPVPVQVTVVEPAAVLPSTARHTVGSDPS